MLVILLRAAVCCASLTYCLLPSKHWTVPEGPARNAATTAVTPRPAADNDNTVSWSDGLV